MEIDVTENGSIRAKKVYCPLVIECESGEVWAMCEREGRLEIKCVAGGTAYNSQSDEIAALREEVKALSETVRKCSSFVNLHRPLGGGFAPLT